MIRVLCMDISGLDEADYRKLYEKASLERKSRADRYRRQEDALRCVTADALLCFALGTDAYTVKTTRDGKPFMKGRADFYYNLSHSGRWVVLAFGDSEVGVDVEQIRTDTDIEAIASRFFSPEEQRYVLEDPAQSRCRFFEVWTEKESYVKYLGTGLKKCMPSFSVLSLKSEVRFHQRELPGGYCLSLCTTEDDYLFELLNMQRLMIKEN